MWKYVEVWFVFRHPPEDKKKKKVGCDFGHAMPSECVLLHT